MKARRHTAVRGLAALAFAALGLVVALAGSSAQTSVGGKGSRVDLRRLAPGAASRTSAARKNTGVEIKHGARVTPASFDGNVQNLPFVRSSPAPPELEQPGAELALAPKVPLARAIAPATGAVSAPSAPMPSPTVSFNGLDKATFGAGFPPDTVGDVGPDHFIQAVNTSIGIYSKTGTQLAAFTFNSLWSTAGTGTLCDTTNRGDPTVVYDPQGGRWIVADFAFSGDGTTPPFFECIAVSKTNDPVAGGWFLYAFRTDDAAHPFFADYPKMGIWPDGLYMTANMFDSSLDFAEVRVWAFNRTDLESGGPVRNVVIDLGSPNFFSLMPSNMRTATGIPPPGRENLLVSESNSLFAFEVWKFHVDYSGAGSTFSTSPINVSQTMYTVAPSTVPTPANALDTLLERMMMQAQYTNLGGAESLWVNHTVRCCGPGTPTGIQWSQINVTGGTVTPTQVQQQLYPSASDGLHRWMGSLAVDQNGDMALGYSVANGTTNPDIRYAGRLAGDTLGALPQTETTMLSGITRGSQNGNCGGHTCTRWGDYSAMSLDPDGCRFWYTQEYYGTTGLNWLTRIGSFSFPSCTPKAYQTITFGPLADKSVGDPDFTVAATASSGLAVSFSASGSCTVVGTTVHLTGGGTCTITASQPGNSSFANAPDVPRTFSIARAAQTITFGPLQARSFADPDFAVSATASSGLAVSFAASGGCTVAGSTVHITSIGSCTVTASQPGNASFTAAVDVARTFAIAKANQAITFGVLAGKTFGNADFPVSASSSSGLAVSFAASGKCTITGATVHITGAGSCTVTASQAGNANVNPAADVAQSFAIGKASQTIAFAALRSKTFGAPNFTVHATASSGLAVSFAANGSCSVKGTKVHLKSAGRCTLTASQSGNANYNPAKRVARAFKVLGPPCSVPNVVGKKPAAAKSSIAKKHCRTGKVGYAYSTKVAKGRVVSQSRRAGRVLAPGAKINIVVSRGRRP